MAASSIIEKIADGIVKAFDTVRPILTPIPSVIMLCSFAKRPGLSAIGLTSAIINRLPEAGINIEANTDGSQNKILAFVRIISEEFIKEIKDNARVDMFIAPGGMTSFGTGANAGGAVTIYSTNVNIATGYGAVR